MVESTLSVQTLGIGVSSFITTLIAAFLFINAYREPVARAFAYGCAGLMMWSWFGFFYQLTDNVELARQLRIVSLIGETLFLALFVRFGFIYKAQAVPHTARERLLLQGVYYVTAAFVTLFIFDMFGSQFIVGYVLPGALAPFRGPFFDQFALFYAGCASVLGFIMWRRITVETGTVRRGGLILLGTMIAALMIGAGGFATWYGINAPILALLRALAVPLLGVGAFYAMSNYSVFNLRVAAANFFVFAMWSFLFFRILLNPSFRNAVPDVLLLAALIVLGIFLIRSIQRELEDRIIIERAERERAIEQAKSEFISIAAHQLRTPLSGIRWTFTALQDLQSLPPEHREMVKKGGERTLDVIERVNEMLRAAKLSNDSFTFAMKAIDLRSVLKDVVASVDTAAKARGLELSLSLPRKPLSITGDREKIAIVFQNLVDNAIKYTKAGRVSISADAADKKVSVRIEDTGIGLSPDDQKHLFEKFYRNDRATKMFTDGSGLGLFIVKKIVDAHNGTIEAASSGNGTLFTVLLPQKQNPAA